MNSTVNSSLETRNIVALVLFSVEFILGVIGNGLVLLSIICQKSQRHPTYIIIGSLALADLLFIVGRVSQEILRVAEVKMYSNSISCKASLFIFQLSSYTASYHLVLLAVVRYICLVHPFKAQQHITNGWALRTSFTLWLGLTVVLSPLLFTIGTVKQQNGGKTEFFCNPNPSSQTAYRDFAICYSLFSYFVPLAMLIIFHSIKAKVVRKMTKTLHNNDNKQMSAMVVLVILLFGVLLFPVHCKNMFVIAGYNVYTDPMQDMDVAFRVLAYLNSCINPLVYAILSTSFRNNLKELFCRCKKNGRVSQAPAHTSTTQETNC